MKNREKNSRYYDGLFAKSIKDKGEYYKAPEQCYYFNLWDRALASIPKESRIYDFGCGPGQLENLAIRRGYNIVRAIDFSKVAIARAKAINPSIANIFNVQNILSLAPYEFKDYDVAVMIEVLEHVYEDIFIIRNILQGRKIIFSVPPFLCLGHVRCFDSEKQIIARYGKELKIISIDKIKTDKSFVWLVEAIKL